MEAIRAEAMRFFEMETRSLVHRLGHKSELTYATKIMILAQMNMAILEAILEVTESVEGTAYDLLCSLEKTKRKAPKEAEG